jgi:small subunit ribosomal protein S17e
MDFQTNKRLLTDVSICGSKRLRNKIAGFTTHLLGRIQKGPVRGISFKLQEEERERKDNYVPAESALKLNSIEVDGETQALLESMNFGKLPGIKVREERVEAPAPRERRERRQPRA